MLSPEIEGDMCPKKLGNHWFISIKSVKEHTVAGLALLVLNLFNLVNGFHQSPSCTQLVSVPTI